jgi:rubrerythrin
MPDNRISELVETAISREEAAYAFYMDLHQKVDDVSAHETLEWIAGEEENHKKFLIAYRDGGFSKEALRMSDVMYYKIAEYQEEPEIEKVMRREDVFLIASHRELRSYNFYTALAKLHPEGEFNEILLKIANEELKHKEKMEYLYANTAFPQTAGG